MIDEFDSRLSGTELKRLRGLLDYLQECDPDTPGDKDARQQIESLFVPRKPCDTCRRLQAKLELNAEDYAAELSRLRSATLTAEEREAVFQFWSYGATRGNHNNTEVWGPVPGPLTPYIGAMGLAVARLRRAAQLEDDENTITG